MRMSISKTAVSLTLATVMFLFYQNADAQAVKVRVDAAYTSPSMLYLISGKELMYISRASKTESIHFEIYTPEKLTKLNIQAAYKDADISRNIVFYYGPKYGLRVKDNYVARKINYGPNDQFPKNEGPDAAARKGDDVYFFRGKKVSLGGNFTTWEEAEDIKKYKGMPKNIDAAWNDGDGMYLLKGNRIWRWNKDNTVSKPILFHDEYHVTSWILKK